MLEGQVVVVGCVVERLHDAAAVVCDGTSEPPGISEHAPGGEQLGGDSPRWWLAEERGLRSQQRISCDTEGLLKEREHGELGCSEERDRRDVRSSPGVGVACATETRRRLTRAARD